ncbi:MAG: ABC transporter ATP-binding protein YtrB [Bacteroidetes bacterium ADurb.BinA174]|nr:MAG: ABC transporter ATP-binding protein YtrB [Bacteroidetes bacterium ADurb.BinA174]
MIAINNLSFKYGKKEILSDISMTLEAGKIYGLLGENGVGKTTLLKIICGLQKPFAGSCTVQGENPFNRTPSFLSSLYYLPEDLEYIQLDMSITQFSKLNAPFYPKFDYEKFEIILKEFDVNGDKKLNKLSHGQTKKAAIAFAIATNADLLLMDEPSNGLDIPSKTLFRRIIVEYVSDNTCTIISTHQVRDLENLIDPIIILDNKAVLMNASLEKISEKLYFGLYSSVPANALYFEPAPGGYICVMENEDMGESKVNIEALFNATMQHKSRIQQLLA